MFKKILLPIWFVVGLILGACQSQPPTPTVTPAGSLVSQQPTEVVLATSTHIPMPTATKIPVQEAIQPTISPSSTQTPVPTVVTPAVWFSATPASAVTEGYELGLLQALGGKINALTVVNSEAYVSIGVHLVVLDLQNPAEPQEVTRYFQPNISALAGYEQVVYVAWDQEVKIFERTAGELKPITTLTIPFVVEDLKVQDGQLWVTTCGQSAECQHEIYDLTNPLDPQSNHSVITPALTDPISPYTLTITFDDTRFEFDGQQLSSYDSNNTLLKQVNASFAPGRASWAEPYLLVDGMYCEGVCGFWLKVFDLRQPTELPEVFSLEYGVHNWFQTADYLYFTTERGFLMVDKQSPMKAVGEWQAAGAVTQLEAIDSFIYGYDGSFFLTQFNLSESGQWAYKMGVEELTQLQSDQEQLLVSNGRTLTYYDPGIDINVKIPLIPEVGGFGLPPKGGFGVIHNGLIYHSYKDEGETIWHTSQIDGSEVIEISEQPLGEQVSFEAGLWHNNYIWAYTGHTLYKIDVSDSAGITWPAPSLVLDGYACDMVATEDYLYLILGEENCYQSPHSLVVIEIHQDQPTVVHTQTLPNRGYRLAVDGQFLYVATGELLLYSLANPAAPTLAYTFDLPGFVTDVQLQEDSVWVAAGADGLLRFTKP